MKQLLKIFLVLSLSTSFLQAQDKIVIDKAADLPKYSYVLNNRDAVEIVSSKEKTMELAAMIKKDLLGDLEKYDIKENATLREYYGNLRVISVLEGDNELAMDYIRKQRELADKESAKIMTGIQSEVIIEAMEELDSMDPDKLGPQLTSLLKEKLNAQDFEVLQEEIEAAKGNTEILSKNLLIGIAQTQVQPALDNNKEEVPGDLVKTLISLHYSLNYSVPYSDYFRQAYADVLEENIQNVEKVNIWEERDVAVKEESGKAPVLIAIWDTGIDMPVFPKNKQWINTNEAFDGSDTDGNGFVDDVYGISYNLEGLKDPNYLDPTAANMEDIKAYQKYIKGFMDLQANIKSEEASNLRIHLSQLKPEEVNGFLENLSLYSIYAHGTHVAGIAEAGNDIAKVLSVRFTADYKSIPSPPTDETVANSARSYGEIIRYLKDNDVQIVNMSWGASYEGTLAVLELNGIGEDDAARKVLAKKYFDTTYTAFKSALESAPDILFICAAGNSDDDVDFSADYPSSLNLPNLITVGAVDIEGKKTSFTTEGESVDVYANGYEVDSYVPGGDRVAFSGTSMASPNVANLAGKILAVNPGLKPEQVIEIIINTSTTSAEDEKVRLVHPKNALELASSLMKP